MTLDLFTSIPKSPTKEQWLERARDLARQIAEEQGEVDADAIHDRMSIPQGIDRRVMGAVFDGMRHIGFKRSKRSECHHRVISRFTIAREPHAA